MFRYTLGFGKVSKLLGYNALKDFFPRSTIRPNPECPNEFCRKHQQRVKKEEEERKKLGIVKETEKVIPKHSENTWGIELVASDEPEEQKEEKKEEKSSTQEPVDGMRFAYDPAPLVDATECNTVKVDEGESVNDLADMLKKLQTKK